MKERIKRLMESQHLSQKAFAQFTGISEGTLSGVLNDRTRPTLQIVEAVHNRFPNISLEWLLYGVGNMEAVSADAKTKDEPDVQGANPSVNGTSQVSSSPLFSVQHASQTSSFQHMPLNSQKEVVKIIDKPARKITEIRVFYDDQTWESFGPKH